jgi:hypothetical protein
MFHPPVGGSACVVYWCREADRVRFCVRSFYFGVWQTRSDYRDEALLAKSLEIFDKAYNAYVSDCIGLYHVDDTATMDVIDWMRDYMLKMGISWPKVDDFIRSMSFNKARGLDPFDED